MCLPKECKIDWRINVLPLLNSFFIYNPVVKQIFKKPSDRFIYRSFDLQLGNVVAAEHKLFGMHLYTAN